MMSQSYSALSEKERKSQDRATDKKIRDEIKLYDKILAVASVILILLIFTFVSIVHEIFKIQDGSTNTTVGDPRS